MRRVEPGRAVDPEVAFVWDQMATPRGQVRVDQLAAEVGWSRKRLWSRLRSRVGSRPNAPRTSSASITSPIASPRVTVPPGWRRRAATSTSPTSIGTSWRFAEVTTAAVAFAPLLAVDDVAWSDSARAWQCGRHTRSRNHRSRVRTSASRIPPIRADRHASDRRGSGEGTRGGRGGGPGWKMPEGEARLRRAEIAGWNR